MKHFYIVGLLFVGLISCNQDNWEPIQVDDENQMISDYLLNLSLQLDDLDFNSKEKLIISNQDFFYNDLERIIKENDRNKKLNRTIGISEKYSHNRWRKRDSKVILSQLDSIVYGNLLRTLENKNFRDRAYICDFYLKSMKTSGLQIPNEYENEISFLLDFLSI